MWNPWVELRGRPHLVFALRSDLPEGVRGIYAKRGSRAVIAIDRSLDRIERNAVLAHELVHDELGVVDCAGAPATWSAVVARQEAAVNREVARRLVPLDELEAFVVVQIDLGHRVDATAVAEEFEVPDWLAEIAMRELRREQAA